ncbi:immunoglobulin J chain [Tachyglossus aculeatus]|uniref:immunoglobulin J chain n=1 Tax=Tachyglossus aculeatus TaxID=9261 RepID=UPI0018F27A1D|nr:immunoglobulin J chain [Tachyglossus aculeatus]
MKVHILLWGTLAVLWGATLVAALDDEEDVLVDNKCKCTRVTSRFVPSKENPNVEVLERNIRIIIPLKTRQNVSDPTSPLRTRFVYELSKLCQKCDQTEVELDHEVVTATQGSGCDQPSDDCYTYDRNKCYMSTIPFTYGGETKMVNTVLTPESCYPD